MTDQTLVQDRPAPTTLDSTGETVENPTVTDAPVDGTPTTDPKVTFLRTKRAMAAAAAGLVLVGGAGGFAIGNATASDGGTSSSFGPGGRGGMPGGTGQGGPNGQTGGQNGQTGGQNGFPGTQNGQMGTPPGMPNDGTTDGTTQDDSTTDGTSSST